MDETEFDLQPARTLRAIDAALWLGRPGHAYWCEWSHPAERPRSFTSLMDGVEHHGWPRHIRPGSVAIDVGGHSGDTAIPMGLFAYDRDGAKPGTVIVVEPNPEVLRILRINLALNAHIADFRLAPYAITEKDLDEIELSDHGNAHCNGGILGSETYSTELNEQLRSCATNRYKARGVSFPTLLRENGIDDFSRVSFIKTDCEGYDKEILRGASDFLQIYKPTLYVEWFAWFKPTDDADFLAAIREIDYVALNPETLQPASVESKCHDVLCVHRSKA